MIFVVKLYLLQCGIISIYINNTVITRITYRLFSDNHYIAR